MAGAAVLLVMLNTVVTIDSAFNSFIISLCRELPLVLLLQFFFFRRKARSSARSQPTHGQSAQLKI